MDTRSGVAAPPEELNFRELIALERRVRREGIKSLSPEEREAYERAENRAREMLRPIRPKLEQQLKAFRQLTPWERNAYPDLTAAEVLALRRTGTRRGQRSQRVSTRRRTRRASTTARDGPSSESDSEPPLAASTRGRS